MRKRIAPWWIVAVVGCAFGPGVQGVGAADPAPDKAALEFFERKVRPLLVEQCFSCHSVGQKKRGGLLLDSRVALLKGGDSGPSVTPGDPAKSLLVKAVGYKDELRMPPRSKLSDEQIADLTAWVKMGAPWSGDVGGPGGREEFDLKKRLALWSFQPVRPRAVPRPTRADWARNPVDAFVLAALEAKTLGPAPETDRATLLRRVTYDLTGLPPTPDEIAAFLQDGSPGAYEAAVERLLASPGYGERWGRHWLDLMRFAETSGHEFDFEIADAHGYRDYVVRALNADLPYDRFVTEHVAGDLVKEPRRHPADGTNESLLATGFWFLGESKHSPVDLRGDGADRRDNQIDVFSKTFLGLTISCARCHDHKFDPITTKEYYSLVSYLQSSRQQRAFLDPPERVGEPAQAVAAARAALTAEATRRSVAALRAGLDTLAVKAARPDSVREDSYLRAWRVLTDPALKTPEQFAARRKDLLTRHEARTRQAAEARKAVVAFAGAGSRGDWFATGNAFTATGPEAVVDVTRPVPVRQVWPAGLTGGPVSGRLQGALRSPTFTIQKKNIFVRARGQGVRVRVVIDGFQLIQAPIYGGLQFGIDSPAPRWFGAGVEMWPGQRAYLEVLDDGDGQAAIEEVVFSDGGPPPDAPPAWLPTLLNDSELTGPDKVPGAYRKLMTGLLDRWTDGKLTEPGDLTLLNALLVEDTPTPAPADPALAALTAKLAEAERALPRPRRGLALADGTGVSERVHIRGSPRNLGEEAPRVLPVAVAGEGQTPTPVGSGRMEMAGQLTAPTNPLVARVMVNRLWHHHFGQGLVRSPDDFGHQGERPTHPELLDWLAGEFVRQGWSLKAMHRLMVLSSAYRQQSRSDAEAEGLDPRNELLHRMPIRRLEAEAVRDALLAVSGRLDRTMYGRGPNPHLSEFMLGAAGRVAGPLDGDGRRSIYLNVRRNFLNPMFLAFDYPVPFTAIGRRSVSNVPAQALTLMNNPFALQQARLWGERTARAPGTTAERVEGLYLTAFGRKPVAEELQDAVAFVEAQGREYGNPADPRAWTDLCHVLVNVKEFIFVN